ncbi:MAG TPA: transglycosylase SLT domain-containing protein [Vicinamibacteria bacterium]
MAKAPRSPSEDAVPKRIAEADAHLAKGLEQAKEGHLNSAREEFDRAVDLYLTAPGGAHSDPRLSDAYRRTLDAVQAREMEALAAGDGFRETPAEVASIDAVADLLVTEEPASTETRAKAQEVVEAEGNDFPVELNDAVLRCIDLYQGRLSEWFQAALTRGQRYMPHIREVFAEEGIPQDLAYLALVESAFKPAAYSRARAKGVWQFISSTGREYGLQQDWWVDERSDTEKATRAAARYLRQLYDRFGDWNLAMAAYNAGPGVVQRGIKRYKTRDYWKLRETRALRRETKNYVPLIHAAVVVANAPEQYGFEVVADLGPAHESAPVEGAVDLRVIAECLETPVADIQALNPELRRLATPANRTFHLRVPAGKGEALGPCVTSIPPEKRVRFRTHVVARGQTFASIARANGVRARALADANNLSLKRRLAVGTELIIPIDARTKQAPPRRRAQAPARVISEKGSRVTYRVKPGDTLGAIASQYGATVREIQSWNGLRGTRIAAGNVLTIYTSR